MLRRSPWLTLWCLMMGASIVSALLGILGLAVVRDVFLLIGKAI